MTDRTGQQLGHYRIERFLGQGAFAEVYLGEHLHLGTRAAIKVLHAQLSEEDTRLFQQEARIIARLDHPNVVRVLDFGTEGGILYLVMSYAPNGTLRSRHPRGQRVPLTAVVSYIKQAADALQFAHEQKIIHRDIKPENMLVGERGEILISDFGIATVAHSTRSANVGDAAGTVPYMAPEQITAHPRVASDQYSLAVVAYEWICGAWPFEGTATEIAMKHYIAPVPSLLERAPGLLPGVEQVIMRALAKAPEQRFPTITAFAQALEQASLGQPVPAAPPPPPPLPYGNPPGAANPYSGSSAPLPYGDPSGAANPYDGPSIAPPPPSYGNLSGAANPYSGSSAPPYGSPSNVANPYFASVTPPPLPLQSAPTWQATVVASPQRAPGQFGGYVGRERQKISRRGLLVAGGAGVAGIAGISVLGYLAARAAGGAHSPTPTAPAGATATPAGPTASAIATYTGFAQTVSAVAWSPDGKYIAAGSFDYTVRVWNAHDASHPPLVVYQRHTKQVNHVVWSPDGKYLASASDDATVQVWKATTGELVYTYTGHTQAVRALGWSPDGKYIASGAWDKTAQVWEAFSGKPILTYSAPDFVSSLCWSPDGQYIASGTFKKVQIWHALAGGAPIFTLSGFNWLVDAVAWSPDSTYLATASQGSYQVWKALEAGKPLIERAQNVNALAWSLDNQDRLAVANVNRPTVQIWQEPAGQLLLTCLGPTDSPTRVAWSPDSKYIVAGSFDKKVRIWKVS